VILEKRTRVVCGMSGGVDSSATAALLLEQGYDVVGITLKLWPQDCVNRAEDKCCGPQAVTDARMVAHSLDIPYYVIDEIETFQREVMDYFAAEYRHDIITPIAPAALDTEIGSLWGTTNGFGEQPLVLKELYWQQHIEKDRLIARIGKIDPENYYNSNYWQSDSKYFMNQAFSSFPVRAFPGNGLGANLTAKLSDEWYVSSGIQDAQGKKTVAGFDTFFEDFNLFSAFEVGLTPTLEGYGRGNYRFTAWYRDHGDSNGTPHDAGFDLSFDQHVGKHWIPFLRYGIGEGNINGIDQMVSGGVGWEGRLVTQSDVAGLAGSWGQPSDDDLDDQFALELFYRMQVSPDNQLTVGYQVIVNPVFEPGDDVVGVFELRWRISM